MPTYDNTFYDNQQAGSLSSAAAMVPAVLDLVPATRTIDVGCGVGTWVRAFMDRGVADARGIDGPWVQPERLLVPKDRFRAVDLARPLPFTETYDLASCLEVGEHLPDAASATLVATLTSLAPVVLFSAAIPGQSGTDHINEQWPAYWAALFAARGFRPIDCLRPRFWNDPEVEWWYAQNAVIYASERGLALSPKLSAAAAALDAAGAPAAPLALVHPRCFRIRLNQIENPSARLVLGALPKSLVSAASRRLRGATPPATP